MARQKLHVDAIENALEELGGWHLSKDGNAIERAFEFRNFNEAFAFMTRTALAAERMEHHPDWSNVYKTVKVRLSTHDVGGLTENDFDLARKMNRFAGG